MMRRHLRHISTIEVLLVLMASSLVIPVLLRGASAQRGGVQPPPTGQLPLSAAAQAQINALLAQKRSLTLTQKKIDLTLRLGMRAYRGDRMTLGGEVSTLRSAATAAKNIDAGGRMRVDIKGKFDESFVMTVRQLGGDVTGVSGKRDSIRAWFPVAAMDALAEHSEVTAIRRAGIPRTQRQFASVRRNGIATPALPFRTSPPLRTGSRPNFNRRAMNVRRQITAALAKAGALRAQDLPRTNTGSVISQGDTALGALEARNFFGVNGAGIKIGVLSDSVDFLEQSIASGELPPDVTVLPGQSGVPGAGEGTALLEIIHDLAPGAKLFFASAYKDINSFADNIHALRAAGCDILIDDVLYSNESPFHDDIVSTAVEKVIADGVLYFSAAGNDGNFNDGTASVWEGDFMNSRTTLPLLPGGTLHDFGSGVIANRVESASEFVLGLWWSDPLGASDNDYDLFVMNDTLTTVLDASINVQDGDDDPFEIIIPGASTGERILIFKADGAQRRALHLNNFSGQLGIGTPGATHGHSSVSGAFSIAAIDVALAGTATFAGGPTNQVEPFSSDGYRRVFFKSDGTPFTPGNLLFSDNGGELRKKPDLTATDGVATSVPGFATFFGTSAAAPHAAAIAALLKSANPRATPNMIRQALTVTATDIEAIDGDRDSGAGVVSAFNALLFISAAPSP
jgi:subtilisin family serine protease